MLDISRYGNWDDYGRDAAIHVVDNLRTYIAYKRVHVSVVVVSDSSRIEFDLNHEDAYNYDRVIDTINRLSNDSRSDDVNFYAGFTKVREVIHDSARPSINQLIVLISSVDRNMARRTEAIQLARELVEGGYFIYGLYAERRPDVPSRDASFMASVVSIETSNIRTSQEFVAGASSGFICNIINCEAGKLNLFRLSFLYQNIPQNTLCTFDFSKQLLIVFY